jgi:NitT/TauT family transport system permease protein
LLKASSFRKIAGFVVVLGFWQLLASTGLINDVLLPSPVALIGAAYELLLDGSLLNHTLASMKRVINGFLLAALCGMVAGVVLG